MSREFGPRRADWIEVTRADGDAAGTEALEQFAAYDGELFQ